MSRRDRSRPLVVDLAGECDFAPDLLGQKAASLARLSREGFPVPHAIVLTTEFLSSFLEQTGIGADLRQLFAQDELDKTELASIAQKIIDAPCPDDLINMLAETVVPLLSQGPVAVRSSGTLEDLEGASFAGLYETYLNQRSAGDVRRSIRHAWASSLLPRVHEYRDKHGIERPVAASMAVIVQTMIKADAAGVVFTVNPLSGVDNELLIEATWGLGEALVAGRVDPDRYRWRWRPEEERERVVARKQIRVEARPDDAGTVTDECDGGMQERAVLSETEVATLGRLCVRAQAAWGKPLDIEWARAGGEFQLLQARPITTLSFAGIDGEWTTADFKDGGVSASVCTPMLWSMYETVFCSSLPQYLDGVGLGATIRNQPWMLLSYGRPYWNVGAVKSGLVSLPGFNERQFDEGLGITVAYEGDGITTGLTPRTIYKGLRVLGKLKRSFKQRLEHVEGVVPELDSLLDGLSSIDATSLSDRAMGDRLASIIEDYRRIETEYFLCIYDNSNSQSLFQEELAKLVRRENATEVSVALLGGLCDLSHLRQSRDEESLVAELVRDAHGRDELISLGAAELTRRWQEGSPFPGEHAIRAYIERHGHINPRNLELMFPRWREDPSPAFESLLRRLSGESPSSDHSEVEAAQTQAYDRARDELRAKFDRGIGRLAPWRKRSFLDGLETTRSLLWWREELRMYSTKIHAQVRRFALELGRRLEAGGVIERAEDIFFLEWPDAVALGRGGLEGAEARSRIACASLYYESFKEFDNPDEIGARFGASRSAVADRSSEGLEGIGCSAGTYRGPARVVPSVAEIGRIRSGDVLVTHCTDPGWTTAFSMLGAVVTETGGVLSHAAVIAREYGFPAVLAVAGATRRIRDGALIEVDGSTGRVRLEPGG